jgi:hypothetical protein
MYWLMGTIGLTFAAIPFLLHLNYNLLAVGISVLLGGIIVVISGVKAAVHRAARWEYSIAGILGLAILAAPFILGLDVQHKALILSLFLGAVVTLLAGYQVFFSPPPGE